MISHKLKKRVLKEASLLKQHLTSEELQTLKYNRFAIYPDNYDTCIYGRLTGDCFSKRAHELLSKCAIWPYSMEIGQFHKTSMGVNRWISYRQDMREAFSPIEYYIYHREEKIPILVEYILGERELKVEDL